jgi:hypothetical protein
MDEKLTGAMDRDRALDSLAAFGRGSKVALHIFAWALLAASIWGMVDLAQLWNRPVKLVSGIPGRVIEESERDRVRYAVPFTVEETGEVLVLGLRNNGPVTDYFMTKPETPVGVLYWPSQMTIASVHPLVAGEPAIRGQYPPYDGLLGTSILGMVLATVLLLGGRLDVALYRAGRS